MTRPSPGTAGSHWHRVGAPVDPEASTVRTLALPAVAIVLLQRCLLVLLAVIHGHHELFTWDALWYRQVALHGYSAPPATAGRHPLPSLAFFPLLPLLGRWVHRLVGLGVDASLELVALVGLPLAAWGIAAVGARIADRRTALLLVALWGAAPRGLVTILPYTEALFTALTAWCLYAMLRQQWWRAATLCAVAGLTRSTTAMLALTLGVTWLWTHRSRLGRPRVVAQGLAVSLLSVSGLLAFLGYTAHRTGRWDGYLRVQQQWNMQMGSPLTTLRQVHHVWVSHAIEWWSFDYVALVVVISLVLLAGLAFVRPPLPLWLFAVTTTVWTWAAQNYFWSKARFLLPLFPLGLLPAVLLSRLPRWVGVLAVVALTWWTCRVDVVVWAGHRSP